MVISREGREKVGRESNNRGLEKRKNYLYTAVPAGEFVLPHPKTGGLG